MNQIERAKPATDRVYCQTQLLIFFQNCAFAFSLRRHLFLFYCLNVKMHFIPYLLAAIEIQEIAMN